MKVTLIDYTRDAKDILIFTKMTRRMSSHKAFEEIKGMTEEEKDQELDYVFKTISSPWEFVGYTFFIEGVTRAFTHQLVRHRVGTAFAQQAQRIAKMEDFEYLATGDTENSHDYHMTMTKIQEGYSKMLSSGVATQDARGVLPTNILTTICFGVNLRALNGIMNVRMCLRAQGEFQQVALKMREEVIKVHPWAEKVLLPFCLEWGSCKFPNFKDCPIQNDNPWLVPDREGISKAKKSWSDNIGITDIQPY